MKIKHFISHSDMILEKIKNGEDKAAVDLLYKKVFPLVRKYIVSRSGKQEDVYDLFQDALLDFYRLLGDGEYDERYKVEAFIYNLCIHKWHNKTKRDQRVIFKDDFDENEVILEIKTKEYFFLGKEEQILDQLFSKIGEKCKELLTYTIFNDILMEDIVIRMGFASVAAAKMQNQRCKQKMLDEINKNPEILNKLKENARS